MLTRSKLLFAALAAATMMLTLVANASARNLSVTEREFEVMFNRSPSGAPGLTFEAGGNNITCPITILGHFTERTISKTNTQIGVIKHVEPTVGAEPALCTGGTLTILQETLPWNVSYVSFTGRLPSISDIRMSLSGVAFRITPRGSATCLAGTTTRNPAFGELGVGAGGRVETLRADETISIPLSGGFLCSFASGRYSGTGPVFNLPRTGSITVTLI